VSEPPLSHDELESLLGAFALGAVDGDERDEVESYLERSPRARMEVDALRAAATVLGRIERPLPPDLWERIEAALGSEPPALRLPDPKPPAIDLDAARTRRRASRVPQLGTIAAVLAVLAIVGLGALVLRQDRRIDELSGPRQTTDVASAAAAALDESGSREIVLGSVDQALHATLVVRSDGSAYFVDDNLAALPADQTYQLWAFQRGGPEPVSLGVLGPDPEPSAVHVSDGVDEVAVTAERAPGSPSPTGDAAVRGTLS